jgi:hypothetical protein
MKFSLAAATTVAAFLLSTASARVSGVFVPPTLVPGQVFEVTVHGENYIQSVYDVAIAFGIAPGRGFPGSLGTVLASEYLGPALSNTVGNYSFPIVLPGNTPTGQALFTASLTSLYGAASGPTLETFNVTVNVAKSA